MKGKKKTNVQHLLLSLNINNNYDRVLEECFTTLHFIYTWFNLCSKSSNETIVALQNNVNKNSTFKIIYSFD